MSLAYPRAPSGRAIRLVDLVLIVWTAAWIVVGFSVAERVDELKELSAMVQVAGSALEDSGEQLGSLANIPFVGDRIARVGERLQATGREAQTSGSEAGESIGALSVLLGFSIALIPSVPLIALYAPMRLARVREVRAIRRALRHHGEDPAFRQFLARRAAERLPYHVLREVSENPWEDLATGRFDALAQAELARLGIRYPVRGVFGRRDRRVAH